MTTVTGILEGMFIRGGRKDSFPLFLLGHALLLIGSILLASLVLTAILNINSPFIEGLQMYRLFTKQAVMTAIALQIWVHEIGHYAQFRRFGAPVLGFLIPPIGGIMLPGFRLSPAKNIEAALAGPLTGIVAVPLLIAGLVTHSFWSPFMILLAYVWVFINLLNLLPLFPMDGGWVLTELLTYWMTKKTANKIAWGITLFLVTWLYWKVPEKSILVLQLVLVGMLVAVDFGATRLFNWFSSVYLAIEQPEIEPLTKDDVIKYTCVYIAVFSILALITWLCSIYNPFKFF